MERPGMSPEWARASPERPRISPERPPTFWDDACVKWATARPAVKASLFLTHPFKGVFLRLQLGASLLLTHPFKGVFLRLQLVWPKLLVPLLLGAPKELPKVNFRVCENAKPSAILNFGCAKVLNHQRFSKKTSVWLEFWATRERIA